jgi:hypothetical protein
MEVESINDGLPQNRYRRFCQDLCNRKERGCVFIAEHKGFYPCSLQVTPSLAFYKHLLLSQITYGIDGDVRPEQGQRLQEVVCRYSGTWPD